MTIDEDYPKMFPPEHLPVFKKLISELMEQSLMLSLRPIENSEAQKMKGELMRTIGQSLSEKVLREMVNAAAFGETNIRKPRNGSLSLLSKYVMGKYKPGSSEDEAKDHYPYWNDFLKENKNLIALNAKNGHDLPESAASSEKHKKEPSSDVPTFDATQPDAKLPPVASGKITLQAGLTGGFLLGIFNTLLIIFSPNSINGYWKLDRGEFVSLIPAITISNICAGILFGMICGYPGNPVKNATVSTTSFKEKLLISITCIFIITVFKQAASRDASTSPFQLGTVDFETIAYFTVCIVGLYRLLLVLRKDHYLSYRQNIQQAFLITLSCFVPLILIFLLYDFVIANTFLNKKEFSVGHWMNFVAEYPHPERILLILSMCFVSSFTMLSTKTFFLNYPRQFRLA